MADNWARIVNTTITKYLRDNQPALLRNRVLLALLEKNGRLSFNNSGADFEWKVPYIRYDLTPQVANGLSTYTQKNRWQSAKLPYRSYEINDAITEWEKLKNRGREAIINVVDEMGKNLISDSSESFSKELYKDGNAAGNTDRIHGVGSFQGVTYVVGQKYGTPSDSYANLLTNLGSYGGAGASWPDGEPDYEFDFWASLVTNYTAAAPAWAAATPSWKNNCIEALRYGINLSQRDNSKDANLDVVLMPGSMYRDFESQLDSKERINVDRGAMNDLVALGFKKTVNFEGVDITWEVGCGAGSTTRAFGFCTKQMEIMCQQDQLFKMGSQYPHFEPTRKSYVTSVDFYGNMKFRSPRHFPMWDALGA